MDFRKGHRGELEKFLQIVWVLEFVPDRKPRSGNPVSCAGSNNLSTKNSNLKTYCIDRLVLNEILKKVYGPWWYSPVFTAQTVWSCCTDGGDGFDSPSTSSSHRHQTTPAPAVVVTTRQNLRNLTEPVHLRTTPSRSGVSCSRNWRTTQTAPV